MFFFFFQAEDGIRDIGVTGVQTCALPISPGGDSSRPEPPAHSAPRAPPEATAASDPRHAQRQRSARCHAPPPARLETLRAPPALAAATRADRAIPRERLPPGASASRRHVAGA